ncbi:hypothetical protein UlMin_025108, partial [Ulmus minor]
MNCSATFCSNYVPSSACTSCYDLRFQSCLATSIGIQFKRCRSSDLKFHPVSRLRIGGKRGVICRVTETQTEPDNNDEDRDLHGEGQEQPSSDSSLENNTHLDPKPMAAEQINDNDAQTKSQVDGPDVDNIEVASGSPLPGVKPQQLDESIRIPKDIIEILKTQVFGFDTFFVTGQEPYEGGVLFNGNLRGQAAKSYEKIAKRMEDKFGDEYKLFLLVNPEDDRPVAVVVPRMTLQPEATAVPEWFAAGAFGLVTVFTLLLRNVPALQSNLLSTFDNLELLKNGAPGALVMALILGVHELGHILVANSNGIKLGVPYFVPSWQ